MHHSLTRSRGVTLIELMVVLVILSIVTAFAIGSYDKYIIRSRRADGQQALLDLATRLESYYAQNNTYATATIGSGNAATDITSITTSPQGFYTLSFTARTATSYTVQATPQGAQVNDTECANLTYNSLGQRSQSGSGSTATCWGS